MMYQLTNGRDLVYANRSLGALWNLCMSEQMLYDSFHTVSYGALRANVFFRELQIPQKSRLERRFVIRPRYCFIFFDLCSIFAGNMALSITFRT